MAVAHPPRPCDRNQSRRWKDCGRRRKRPTVRGNNSIPQLHQPWPQLGGAGPDGDRRGPLEHRMGTEGVAGQEDTAASVAAARVLADSCRTSAASTRCFALPPSIHRRVVPTELK
jgi:hypothetical protein